MSNNPLSGAIDRRALLGATTALGIAAMASSPARSMFKKRAPPAIAKTSAGMVRGSNVDGVFSFKSVPYGRAGIALRFRPPEDPTPWPGIKDALEYTTRAPDNGTDEVTYPGGRRVNFATPLPFSEDCLHLNIWTAGLRDGRKRPVMVYLHGGGFHGGTGSSPILDGTRLVRRGDVVVVNINHRTNAFGFLYLSEFPGGAEYPDAGNVGMLDIVQALKWVRTNIAEFGGDQNNVTIFGLSGGSGKVTTLMAMPAAKGLFHRSICMSGSTGIGGRSTKYAALDAEMLMYLLGLKTSQVSELAKLPMDKLREGVVALRKHEVLSTRPWGGFSDREWKPVIDGRTLKSPPWFPDAPRESTNVPLLIGTAKDEVRQHLGANDPRAFDIPWAELEPRLRSGLRMEPVEMIDWYRKRFPEATASELQFKIFTYWRWRHSAIWQAQERLEFARAGTWMYRFDWETPVDGGKWGAYHGIDLPLAFDNVAVAQSVYGGDIKAAQRMADQISDVWIAFARTGDPNCPAVPAWPKYDHTRRATMLFNQTSRVENDPEPDERKFFAKSPPRLSK